MDDPGSSATGKIGKNGEHDSEAQASALPGVAQDTAAGLLEAAPDAILGVGDSGTIAFVNARVVELFGYAREELIDQRVEMLVPPELRDSHEELRGGYQAAPKVRPMGEGQQLRGRRKDGSDFPVEISLSPLAANGQVFVVAIVRDVTLRTEVEAELRLTRDRLLEAERLARLGSWEWDIPNNSVSWSDELFRIYGLEPGELVPSYEAFLDKVHPDDRESVDERNHKAFADHQPFEDVKRCVRPDGEVFLMRTQGEVIVDDQDNPIRMLGVCEDVTAEIRAQEARAMLAAIVQSSDDAISTRDPDGKITSWNPGAEALYGYPEAEIVGLSGDVLIPPDLREEELENMRRLAKGEHVEHYDTRRVHKDGTLIDVSLTRSPLRGPDGELIGVSTIARDITERKRFEAQLTQLANTDPLTGLSNRYRFEEELVSELAQVRRHGHGGAVLVLDLDNFKYINDGFGHGAGDEVLRRLADLLRARLRASDLLARLGGDEFAVLARGVDEKQAHEFALDLLEQVRGHTPQIAGRPMKMTTSIGVAVIDEKTGSAEELLADADVAMYQAKDAGRDRVSVLGAGERGGAPGGARRGWDHRIREALQEDRLVLHAQPILDLSSGEVSQCELLLRMRENGDLIPPNAFLGDAERLGLIHEIDRWVVTQAIGMLAESSSLVLEVNLSGRSTGDEQLLKLVKGEVANAGIDPSRLIFEITETAAIGSIDEARGFAAALRDVGCRFALDDFGAGFGSFYYLKHIPVDFLKIDGDFVRSPRSRADELVVESIVHMASGLGKRTIAEFVEDEATLESLRAKGVDYAQGFHVGRPAPIEEMEL